jgi:protein TonB
MFEDSTFESGGRIKSKIGKYMIPLFIVEGVLLVLLILIPLIYPEALPRAAMQMALVGPPEVHQAPVRSEMMNNQLTAPTRIPHDIRMVSEKEPALASFGVAGSDFGGGGNVMGSLFSDSGGPKVKAAPVKKLTISSGVMQGMLLQKTPPVYPPIAKAARVSGTVVLQATISKTGAIENLHVLSGPAMLQQAALDAVRSWRYRPYLLNGDPVEVETTVNVIFTLGG